MQNSQLSHQQIQWRPSPMPLIVACDNWDDPLNVGAAFRLADAFGVSALWLGGRTAPPPHRKLSRAARGAEKHIPYTRHIDLAEALAKHQASGGLVIALEVSAKSVALHEWKLPSVQAEVPHILVAGAENEGLQPAILALANHTVHIAMHGKVSSLNVSSALGIALYQWKLWTN